eukprot:CAMPEP_0113491580 /NCGR_PEP_ID=MMETSP0014_2-20120614/27627_1 /TAXON_ID=2857 /ORGANISM="Nitzschia sp." /LENGTH=87 /DNA_ID=CAMNT_0000385371 /DNA_START=917 /DNA_END=1177 /DNA_ORIENTATION=- /assembly_acc=CAM_ASM_000159
MTATNPVMTAPKIFTTRDTAALCSLMSDDGNDLESFFNAKIWSCNVCCVVAFPGTFIADNVTRRRGPPTPLSGGVVVQQPTTNCAIW